MRTVVKLPDPVGETFDMRTLPSSLQAGKRRVHLGVIAAIYESRPNVTMDIASLYPKSGNAAILRGGKDAVRSNTALARVVSNACMSAGVPEGAVSLIESTDGALVGRLLKMREAIDLIIPRRGAGLIKLVSENATMPVVTGGIGVCHTHVDRSADLAKATAIVYNAKVRRCTICNALHTVLVHRDVARSFLPKIGAAWSEAGVEMQCDQAALRVLQSLRCRSGEGRTAAVSRRGRLGQGIPGNHRRHQGRRFARRGSGTHYALWLWTL